MPDCILRILFEYLNFTCYLLFLFIIISICVGQSKQYIYYTDNTQKKEKEKENIDTILLILSNSF